MLLDNTGEHHAALTHSKPQRQDLKMKKRKLGTSNLEVSALGFACMNMSFAYGPLTNEELI
jgi:hypothetical protein